MTKIIIRVSQEYEDLAKKEFEALTGAWPENKIEKGHYQINANAKTESMIRQNAKSLALTKSIWKTLTSFRIKNLDLEKRQTLDFIIKKETSGIDFFRVIKEKYAVRIKKIKTEFTKKIKIDPMLRSVSSIIYKQVSKKGKTVSISDADTNIVILYRMGKDETEINIAEEIFSINEKFYLRRPDKRPCLKPISLSPRIARVCINLLKLKEKRIKTIIDPCCGTGGFLIEAGIMGYELTGMDILPEMIQCTKNNLNYFGISNYELRLEDITKSKPEKQYDGLVTDLPYGKNTKSEKNIEESYKRFIRSIKKYSKNIVIITPSFIDINKVIKNNNLKPKYQYEIKVHNTLNRVLTVIWK